MAKSVTLAELAKTVGGVVRGDASVRVRGVRGVEDAGPDELTWISHEKYASRLTASRAGAVVVDRHFAGTPMPAILCDDPSFAMTKVLAVFAPPVSEPAVGIHPTAVVAAAAKLGRDVRIGPHVVIGDGASIGDRCVLHANVFVGEGSELGCDCVLWPGVVVRERCTLGKRVIVHPNATIGADGFGYHYRDGVHHKIPQIGTVDIGDDVEIGAGSCVDRAKFGATRIGAGSKIDNLVQIAHNVELGQGCVIVAQCGIAGSARLGRFVVLGGKVGVRDHVVLGDGVKAVACTCISKDYPPNMILNGIPAVEHQQLMREHVHLRRLPELAALVKELAKRVEALESSADDSQSG
jgi:UDP-3-O-[3-hydroxymyristoyl] glucosamine N-acyltransferase